MRWWAGGLPVSASHADAMVRVVARTRIYKGDYLALHVYLRDRFADRVVLSFSQIEDLLGFALPAAARHESAWWDDPHDDAASASQADTWRLASRTAVANMPA